jgi:hypothetical protein
MIADAATNNPDAEARRIFRAHRGRDHEPHDAYAADALAAFVRNPADPDRPRDPNATVHVIIDHGALLRGGTADGEVCEIAGVGPVDINWVRTLIGSAFLTAVIKRGKDILTVGHLGRHVPAEIQTALLVSGHECQIEGCYQRGYLERDHTHDHAHGGPTAYWNLKWLCAQDHRRKTRGWTLGPPTPPPENACSDHHHRTSDDRDNGRKPEARARCARGQPSRGLTPGGCRRARCRGGTSSGWDR